MPRFVSRDTTGVVLSTTAIFAIVSGIGAVLLIILAFLIFRLIQARRTHKRLLADLEARGVLITQAQKEAKKAVARPRAVLRRNTVLPFNPASGWGSLTSVETFGSGEPANTLTHYAPAPPAGGPKKNNRLSWPFSPRRISGHHGIQMKNMKAKRLSTVIEDPRLSPLMPRLNSSHLDPSRSSLAFSGDYTSHYSSSQSLLRDHPAFRNQDYDTSGTPLQDPIAFYRSPRTDPDIRLMRARSAVEISSTQPKRPHIRTRSTSLCDQPSGRAPDVILPPLPLDIARIKSETKRRSQLKHAHSQLSVSSHGSADTSILSTGLSPVAPNSAKSGNKKITKPNAKGSSIAGGRSFRDTLDLHAKALGTRSSVPDNATHDTNMLSGTQEMKTVKRSTKLTRSTIRTPKGRTVTLSKAMSPSASLTTPKRKSKTLVSASGSPERQCSTSTNPRSLGGAIRTPKRQPSQASSRSSGGNPFQWDLTQFSPSAIPSALKGSPNARQGHGQKNGVRISLVPTIHGLPSQTSSPLLAENKESDAAEDDSASKSPSIGTAYSSTCQLPTLPRFSTFAPELKFPATPPKKSLIATSELPLEEPDQHVVVLPSDQNLTPPSKDEQKSLGDGSVFASSQSPITPSITEPVDYDMRRSISFSSLQSYECNGCWMPGTPLLEQNPFGVDHDSSSSPTSPINISGHDPEQPSSIYQTFATNNSRAYQSTFPAIPEESSVGSNRTLDAAWSRYDDSPAISPKTSSPPRFTLDDRSAYNVPVHATTIPEEPVDTIDPSILTKDRFSMLYGPDNDASGSITGSRNYNPSNTLIPTTYQSDLHMFAPIWGAVFPSSPPHSFNNDSPTIGHTQTEQSSLYTMLSPSSSPTVSPIELPSPLIPSSPLPTHTELPNKGLSINFTDVPRLNPSPLELQESPSKPLRTSIAQLRRMNSDAADAKKAKGGRGERRYLRVGREDSVQARDDASWLGDMDAESGAEFTEEDGSRRIVSSIFDNWEEECTPHDFDEGNSIDSTSTVKPSITLVGEEEEDEKEEDTKAGASRCTSSVWEEDGENFWTSSSPSSPPPPRPISPSKVPPSSPASIGLCTPPPKVAGRKRDFEVARDPSPELEDTSPRTKKKRDSNGSKHAGTSRTKRRSALGGASSNVKIQVTSPGGHVVGNSRFGSLGGWQASLRR